MTPSTFTKSPVLQVKEKTVKVDGEVWTGAGDGRQGHVVDSDHLALVVNTDPRHGDGDRQGGGELGLQGEGGANSGLPVVGLYCVELPRVSVNKQIQDPQVPSRSLLPW